MDVKKCYIDTRIDNIRQQKISGGQIYHFLLYFVRLYDKFTDSEKKEFLNCLIERVEIFPEALPNGRIQRSIKFRFPVFFAGREVQEIGWDNESMLESVVCLSREKADDDVRISVHTKDLQSKAN